MVMLRRRQIQIHRKAHQRPQCPRDRAADPNDGFDLRVRRILAQADKCSDKRDKDGRTGTQVVMPHRDDMPHLMNQDEQHEAERKAESCDSDSPENIIV